MRVGGAVLCSSCNRYCDPSDQWRYGGVVFCSVECIDYYSSGGTDYDLQWVGLDEVEPEREQGWEGDLCLL